MEPDRRSGRGGVFKLFNARLEEGDVLLKHLRAREALRLTRVFTVFISAFANTLAARGLPTVAPLSSSSTLSIIRVRPEHLPFYVCDMEGMLLL